MRTRDSAIRGAAMRRLLYFILTTVLTGSFAAARAGAAHATPEQIERAIHRAQKFLLTHDLSDNAPINSMPEAGIGQSSLGAYALLVRGIDENDPRLAPTLRRRSAPALRETSPWGLRALMLSELHAEPAA